MMMMMMMIRA